jgi:hypothetical protein
MLILSTKYRRASPEKTARKRKKQHPNLNGEVYTVSVER